MLQSWRQRRMFERLVAKHIEHAGPLIDREHRQLLSTAARVEAQLARLPGATPRCPSCRGRLEMKRIPYRPYRARKDRWRAAYVCVGCSREYPVAEVRGAAEAAAEDAA